MGIAHNIQEKIFSRIHLNNLVYNTCWEDPRCDRAMLGLDENSRIAMLTSAGCNALDYLLDNPAEIHCVDMNPRQNALLELKKAFFKSKQQELVFDFFGHGAVKDSKAIYFDAGVRAELADQPFARQYWDRRMDYFSGKGLRRSFYWHGSSGTLAWLIQQWFRAQPKAMHIARAVFESENMEEQRATYEQLEPRFLNPFLRRIMRQHVVQSMLGVPKSQQELAATHFSEGMAGYVRHCLRHVFCHTDLRENYFWRLYFYGQYTRECCPNYLKAAHFDTLQARVDRIITHTCPLNDFLKANPDKQFTHYVLLDHQDWLAAHLKGVLEEEWRLIFQQAAPGARVLLRSASFEPAFLPDFVQERVVWDVETAIREHARDRVGTYASTWLGTIQPA